MEQTELYIEGVSAPQVTEPDIPAEEKAIIQEFFSNPKPLKRTRNPLNLFFMQALICAAILISLTVLKFAAESVYTVISSYISLYIYA